MVRTGAKARLSDLLRTGAPSGAPVDVILESWAQVEDAVLADGALAREALDEAAAALPSIAGAIGDRRAVATAVMTQRGDIFYSDEAFRALIAGALDGDSAGGDLRPLLKRALREGPTVGLVEGAGGAAFTAWVGDAAASRRWPLEADAAAALSAAPGRLAVVVSAPSRSSALARRAARALDLTALEARLAEALLFAPNLDVAAADAGVGRETARDALRRVNAKAGVRRTPELVARLIEIMCSGGGEPGDDEALAVQAFRVTPAEARVAAQVAHGATTPEAAQALGVSPETVKTHLKAVLQKTGAKGGKDLARLLVEARELIAMADASEAVFGEEDGGGRLRVVASLDARRRIALIDYGPYDGEPVMVFHGAAAGRRLPEAFRAALCDRGLRPIVVQRPGFGLTDPANGDYAETGADDIAAALERLRLKSTHMMARDTGIPVALAFAGRHPDKLGKAVLLNPQPPMSLTDDRRSFVAGVQRHLLRNADLVTVFAEFLRRQATTELLTRIIQRAFADVPTDAAALQDPVVKTFLIRDIQALCARSAEGFAAEHAVYAGGWAPHESAPAAGGWTVGLSSELPGPVAPTWLPLPQMRTVWLKGAGILPQFTCPEALAALLD